MGEKEDKLERERMRLWYRFHMPGYSLQGTAHWGPSDIIPEGSGNYAMAKPDCNPIPSPPLISLVPTLSRKKK